MVPETLKEATLEKVVAAMKFWVIQLMPRVVI